ncbi:hypothetical protein L526_4278 [Bordetella bronchiseptica MBORD785]|nr:hypothetical protein L526_4278 [Bordetella bronchiseptica MBORD785]
MARDRGFSTRRGGRPRRLAHLRCNRLWLDLAPMRYCRQYYDWRRPWQISLASPGWLAARRGTSPAPVPSCRRRCLSPPGQAPGPRKTPTLRPLCGRACPRRDRHTVVRHRRQAEKKVHRALPGKAARILRKKYSWSR